MQQKNTDLFEWSNRTKKIPQIKIQANPVSDKSQQTFNQIM